MRSLIYSNLTTRKPATDDTGGALAFPSLVGGQQWTIGVRFTEKVEGTYGETFPDIHSIRASMGNLDARPETGGWKLQVGSGGSTGSNTTGNLNWSEPADRVKTALKALSGGTNDYEVEWDSGSYIVYRTGGGQILLTPRGNTLRPVSMVRIREYQVDGAYRYDVRLIQAPIAFTDSAEQVLPKKPYIETVVDGGTDASGTYFQNEVQNLIIPADFRGAFYLTRGSNRTQLLSEADGAEEIQTALNAMLATEGGTVTVTNPQTSGGAGVARMVFGGTLSGVDIAPLGITAPAEGTPPGDWTFTLDLNRWEVWAALRALPQIAVPFELEIAVYLDPADHSAGTKVVKCWSEPVTITRPLMWEGLAAAQNIDWLRPPSPKDYVPFSLSQVLTGQQQAFSSVIGNGSLTSFVIDHNLASELCQVIVCENSRPGRLLRDNEYSVSLTSNNSVTVSGFASTPTAGQYAVYVVAIGPESVFQSHTHTIGQITGLQNILDDLTGRVTTLEKILPSTGPSANTTQASGIEIALPETQEILFFRGDVKAVFGLNGADSAKLGYPPMLLPAVHKSSATSYTTGDLPAVAADSLWQNNSGSVLEMGGGIYGGRVATSGFFASDGRALYAADRSGTTTSYFPTGFERELWRIFVNDKMLRLNRTLDVRFGLALQLLKATSNAQWMLVIEKGTAPSDTSPSTPATNLQNITWAASPILAQRLILTGNRQTHSFGTRIKRALVSTVDTLTLDTLLYGVWDGNNSAAPSAPNFALRARLIQFDTENALASDARGWIACEIIGADKDSKPKASIL